MLPKLPAKKRSGASILVVVGVLLTVVLAGCGGSGGASSGGKQPVTLTWFMWSGSPEEVNAWNYDASLVTQQYPWIHIKFQTTSFNDYWTKLESEAASGTLPDIISLQSQRAPGFAQVFRPLDSYIQQNHFDISAFNPTIVQGLTYQGKLRALPYDFGPMVVFYNKALFDQNGVPYPTVDWTYSQFLQDAQKLTHGSDYGFVAPATPDYWLPFGLSAGAHYLTPNHSKVSLTDPKLASAFQDYAKLVYQYHAAPPESVPQSSQSPFQFAAGNIGMVVDGPWDMITYKTSAKFSLGVAPLPVQQGSQSTTMVAGSGFGISSTSQHPDDAWKAISVLTGPTAEQYLSSHGRAFSARTAQQQYWYQNAVPGAQDTLTKAISESVPFYTTPNWNEVSTLLTQQGVNVVNGAQPAARALQQVQAQVGSSS